MNLITGAVFDSIKTGKQLKFIAISKQITCVQRFFYDMSSINRSPESNPIKYVRNVVNTYKFKVTIMDYMIVMLKYKV